MPIETDLSQSPYFDDFNANNQFYQILARPSAPIQIREINQIQTNMQYQIEKFGKNIFVDGSIVDGCKITFNSSLPYVKVLDTFANNSAMTISNFQGQYLQSVNGLRAYIFSTVNGYASQAPNLNTFYVNYLNSSTDTTVTSFQNDEVLTLYSSANIALGQVTVANTISSGNSAATGQGYSITVGDGTIFHKGYFLDVLKQSMIISPYNNYPDQISVGFNTVESIITPEENSLLLDNAAGAANYAAPGAHRLKLTPTLTVRATSSSSVNNFFSIVDFVEGNPAIINQGNQYAAIGDQMAQRTNESDGNFIIDPFNVRVITKYDANTLSSNGVIANTGYCKLEIDPGLAYVQGYRVQTVGKLVNKIRKGTDVAQTNAQTITTTLGNYLIVNEYAGVFNPTGNLTVSLRNATSTAVSNNLAKGVAVNSIAAAGSQIGQANIIAIQYYSGVPGTPSAQYKLYISNIYLNTGANFNSIRSVYVGGTTNGVCDVVLDVNGNATLQETALPSLVYPFNQQAIKTLKDTTNVVSGQFDFYQNASVNFTTSGVASITVPSYIGGTNSLTFGSGLLDSTSETSFVIVAANTVTTANLAGTVAITAGSNTVIGLGTTFTTAYMVGSMINVCNSTVSEIRQVSTIANNTSLTVSAPFINGWSSAVTSGAYVAGQVIPTTFNSTSITINSSTMFTITMGQTFSSAFTANVLYNCRRTSATPASKKLNGPFYVAINCATHPAGAVGPWSLGVPDVLSVSAVYAGTTLSTSNPNIATSMTFDNGQRDTCYGLGYLYKGSANITTSTQLLVELESFSIDTSHGIGFLSVDSYPIDDTGVTANTIPTQNIPYYTSPTTGSTYNLRNCIDFRTYAANTVGYVANATLVALGATSMNPAAIVSFLSNGYNPVIDSSFLADTQYYLGRCDKVGFTTKGTVTVIEGSPSENPVPPADISYGITLCTVNVPPYPTLTIDDATTGVVSLTYNSNKRYTMADIGGLDARISQVEYYTSLNALELSAKNLMLTNSSGQNRMQNGILAEPFQDFSISNTLDSNFDIAIDSANCEARPIFNQQLVNLKYNGAGSSGVSLSSDGRIISLAAQEVGTPYITQPFASQVMNAAQDTMYIWNGNITLNPTGDYQPDVTTNPAVVVTSDSYSNFANMPDPWPTQWGAWEEVSSSSTSTTDNQYIEVGAGQNVGVGSLGAAPVVDNGHSWMQSQGLALYTTYANAQVTTTTTSSQQTQTGTAYSLTSANNTYNFGSYVTDVALQPYCRAMLIQFMATGMKPNTRLYAWMDDTNVTTYCMGAGSNYIINSSNITTDASGTAYGIYFLPADTFYSGDRQFQLCDVNNLTTLSNAITTTSTTTYYGTNISYAKNNITLNTITPQVTATSVSQNQTVTSTSSAVTGVNQYVTTDPLAQGITIVDEKFGSDDIQGVFISSIDLFFESKDPTLGVTIMIRDMSNGYPGPNIQNFSLTHLLPYQVNVASDASIATNVKFEAPVFLETGTEYAIIVMPDGSNPNYNLWVGELGQTDIITNSPIYVISGTGDMFSSSQNTTWTAIQTTRLKFNLYKYNFTSLGGIAQLVNDDSEYFTINNTNGGNFKLGEPVYGVDADITTTGSTTINSNVVTVPNTALFNAGAIYAFRNASTSQTIISTIITILNSTQFTTNVSMPFTSTTVAIGWVAANTGLTGNVTTANSTSLIISNSTANSSYQFSNNMYLFGSTSGAYANVVTLNDVYYDYLMPKFAVSISTDTAIGFSLLGTSNSATSYVADTISSGLTFGMTKEFIDQERVVMSRSNEILYKNGAKSLAINAQLQSATSVISPVIDTIKLGALCIQNNINGEGTSSNVYTSEIQNAGQSINRYISQTVTLATGMDSEDLVVYIGAYWPPETSIYVYAKLENSYDSDPFTLKNWTPLSTTNAARSSIANKQDYNEYIFTLPTTAPVSNTVTQASGAAYTAYLDPNNSNILTYTSATGQIYTSYKTFAIKVVLLSNAGTYLVPRLSDLRAIALPSSA